ncbi:MAG TPA: ABC transporter permease, partial [Thermoanaerobaculia bacterium]|nr:ABC transporter permease [Thermoanaerobaculia bacterium]
VATQAAAPKLAFRGQFLWLLRKELWTHMQGRRVYVGAAISFVLCMLAGAVRIHDYGQAHELRNGFLQRWIPSVEEQLERDETVQVENVRAVSPLSVLSMGLEPVVPFRFTSTKEGLRFGESRGAQNIIDALFGWLDLTFVVTVLLSLLAIAVTFDSVCGERADGTLALLLSYPVRRSSVLLAKVAGAISVLAVGFIPALAAVMLMMLVRGVALMSVVHWFAFGFAAILYLLVFTTLGVAVSASSPRPADAALRCLLVWVLLVFVVPRGVGLAVGAMRPAQRAAVLALKEDQALSQLKVDYSRKEQEAFDRYVDESGKNPSANDDFLRTRKQALAELQTKRNEILRRIWDETSTEERQRERWVQTLSLLSPTALFDQIAAELSWTGFLQRSLFYEQARTWDEKIGRRLAESREVFYSGTPQRITSAFIFRDNIKPYLVPFQSAWVDSERALATCAFPLAMLAAFAALIFAFGYNAFLRLDVRL